MTTTPKPECTCPSGNGSLRWPCPEHPVERVPATWPKDAEEVRAFMRSNFQSAKFAREDQAPDEDDQYLLSAHDFLEAVNWWADFPHLPRDKAQGVPAPVLYVSKEQLNNHRDHADSEAGRYLPCRITPAGKFTTPLYAAPQAQAEDARDAEIALPKTRDVVRIGDIHPKDHIHLEFGFQNDVYVSIRDGYNYASIEFRKPGGDYSGRRSIRTYAALIALSVAMEADNATNPSSNPWAQNDEIAAQAAAQGGA